MSFSRRAWLTASGSGPEFPMQVVHPYPTTAKPCCSRGARSPARRRYSVTTREPGARLVFTHGLTLSPRSPAFFATSPAATMAAGLEVLVQLVIAAITTAPSRSSTWPSPIQTRALPPPVRSRVAEARASRNEAWAAARGTRSWGRLGPARHGCTVDRSNSSRSLYWGTGTPGSRNRPWCRA